MNKSADSCELKIAEVPLANTRILVVCFAAFLAGFAHAQTMSFEFVNTLGSESLEGQTSSNQHAGGVTTDSQGNIYLTGGFSGTVDFDPGPGVFELTTVERLFSLQRSTALYIAKYTSSGALLFVRALDSHPRGTTKGRAVEVDHEGNIVVLGVVTATGLIDLDPGPGVDFVTTLSGQGTAIIKLNSDGEFIASAFVGSYVNPLGMKLDAQGNVYIAGLYQNSFADFNPGPGIYHLPEASGYRDVFILKLSSNLAFRYARSIAHGPSNSRTSNPLELAVARSGDVYVCAEFDGTADLLPGPGVMNITSNGSTDLFVLKLDSGGSPVFVKTFGGTNFDIVHAIAFGEAGELYIGGRFGPRDVDFDPGPDEYLMSPHTLGETAAFVLKLSADGRFQWAQQYVGGIEELETDSNGNVVIGVIDFSDPIGLSSTLGSAQQNIPPPYDFTVMALNRNGEYIFADSFGAGNYVWPQYAFSYKENDHLLITGRALGTLDFDPGPGTVEVTTIGIDTYLLKLSIATPSAPPVPAGLEPPIFIPPPGAPLNYAWLVVAVILLVLSIAALRRRTA